MDSRPGPAGSSGGNRGGSGCGRAADSFRACGAAPGPDDRLGRGRGGLRGGVRRRVWALLPGVPGVLPGGKRGYPPLAAVAPAAAHRRHPAGRISSPLTFGVLRPVILVPKKTDWTDETALRYVLEHEFVHIQRFDVLSKLLLIAAVCVHRFNPLVWVMYVLANRDLELSCDETVLRRFGGDIRAAYARVLIRMEAARGGTAVETGTPLQPDTDYTAAGISSKGRLWYYAGQPVAMIYDDNDSIYMDEEAAGGCYLHVRRDSAGVISGVDVLTKEQFRELADRRMNAASDTTYEESTLMSYVDPADGRTYYSFDGGKTFEPLTDAEFESRFPTPDVVWWTYDEYKAWLDNEKVELQSLLGQTGGDYTWTQQKIDETIALYESILKDIQNGVLYSKTVDGSDDVMLSMNPADIAQTAGCPKNSGGTIRSRRFGWLGVLTGR